MASMPISRCCAPMPSARCSMPMPGCADWRREVAAAFRTWREAQQTRQSATSGAEALERERELLEWQVKELAALAFTAAGMGGRWKPSTGGWRMPPA